MNTRGENMELRELTEKTLKIFNLGNVDDLGDYLMKSVLNNQVDKFQAFVDLVNGDLNKDWIQMIYQYHLADRRSLKQDYTPASISLLLAKYAKRNNIIEVIDICAGSGALTIQQWVENNNVTVRCQEIDDRVIPYLLFNLAIRNIAGTVEHKDVLANIVFARYSIKRGEKFATVHKQSAI